MSNIGQTYLMKQKAEIAKGISLEPTLSTRVTKREIAAAGVTSLVPGLFDTQILTGCEHTELEKMLTYLKEPESSVRVVGERIELSENTAEGNLVFRRTRVARRRHPWQVVIEEPLGQQLLRPASFCRSAYCSVREIVIDVFRVPDQFSAEELKKQLIASIEEELEKGVYDSYKGRRKVAGTLNSMG